MLWKVVLWGPPPGYFQSSLRDFSSFEFLPRTASWAWSFYIFSSGGGLKQFGRSEFEGKGIEQGGLLRHFFA
jgi:hypothetical protein